MTREFNKQRRDDTRPSFREKSPNRYREEHSSPSPRPRLNREMVDRAWESGAQHHHADYRPRSSNGPSLQRNRYNNQPSGHYSPSNGHPRRQQPYANRNKPFSANEQSSTHPFPSDEPETKRTGGYRGRMDERGSSPNYRDRSGNRPFNGRSDQRQGFQPRRAPSGNQAPGYPGRNFSSDRPYPRKRDIPPYQRRDEQFEGDYERFNDDDGPRRQVKPPDRSYRPPRHNYNEAPSRDERHVTRLPDGRVLKGPRPVQRKNARFWTDIEEDTQEVIGHVHKPVPPVEEAENTREKEATSYSKEGSPSPNKARTRSKKTDVARPKRSTGPKPSQRGFKWPTP